MIFRKRLWSLCIGNLFEHYDTALFGFLSPLLATLIFPQHDPLIALILTYAIIPISMIARPLGALVFGYIGDHYSKEEALFLTLGGMALVSCAIALTPTYSQVGLFAPILFCIGRAMQNFLAAGESMGGAIYLLEHVPKKHYDLFSSIYGASTMGGHLLASFGVYLISQFSSVEPWWRYLYLCGGITALSGFLMRQKSPSKEPYDPLFRTIENIKSSLWSNRKIILLIALNAGFAHATYSMALVLINGLIPLISHLSTLEVMQINTYMLVLDLSLLPLFGWLASKVMREKLMLYVSVITLLFSMPLFLFLQEASLIEIIGIRTVFIVLGVAFFAPFHAWAQEIAPSHSRYIVISFGYALGSQLLGSPTSAISLWCFHKTGMIASLAWYWMVLAFFSSISILSLYLSKSGHKQEI